VIERVASVDGSTQNHVSAKFMRLSASADLDLAERVVGSRLDLPAVGECRSMRSGTLALPESDSAALAALGSIELVDGGDVTVRAGGATMPLGTRAFPDVGDLVSGVFYTSPDAASELPAGTTYTLEGTGTSAIERFSLDVEAPAVPEDVRVGDVALTDGAMIEPGSPTVVRWRTPDAPRVQVGDRDDVVLVDVSSKSGALVRCAFKDSGEATLPASMFRAVAPGAMATLAVHRLRQRMFSAPGLDAGEVRFDLAVLGRISVGSDRAARAFEIQPSP
jgi:hypothetical protein